LRAIILAIAGRAGLGVILALTFSMVGIGIGLGLYLFSGAVSRTTLQVMILAGAGFGAGLGATLAWLKLEGNPRSTLLSTIMLALLVGGGGAWTGYEYGANREIECCAKPEVGPVFFAAYGATLAANGVLLLLGIAREIRTGRR